MTTEERVGVTLYLTPELAKKYNRLQKIGCEFGDLLAATIDGNHKCVFECEIANGNFGCLYNCERFANVSNTLPGIEEFFNGSEFVTPEMAAFQEEVGDDMRRRKAIVGDVK